MLVVTMAHLLWSLRTDALTFFGMRCAQVTKSDLLEVGAVPFLIDLGVIPFKKSTKENTVRADLFYKIRKWAPLVYTCL